MRDVSVIEINLSHLDHNVRVLRRIVGPECGLCPIVKADAYGLGAARVAKRLAFDGADLLAVYTPDQAAELFRGAVGGDILVLMPVREIARVDELYRGLVSDRLHLTVHDEDHLRALIAMTDRYGVTIKVHLEVDTGMGRGGCAPADAPMLLRTIASNRRLVLTGLFTHFAGAECDLDFTHEQMASFDALVEANRAHIGPKCRIHVASSFAALRSKRFHKAMVRVGLAWAGYGVEWIEGSEIIPAARQLRPIVTWRSRIVQIKTLETGAKVGYGSKWTAPRRSVIGLIPVGYADGYPPGLASLDEAPHAEGGACVKIVGAHAEDEALGFAPVVGAVNMDQITIDLTDIAESAGATRRPEVGCHVELISPEVGAPNHLPTLARLAGTIPHEMLCRLNPRLKRTYVAPIAESAGFTIETKTPLHSAETAEAAQTALVGTGSGLP